MREGPACENTCYNRNARDECQFRDTEVCACPKDTVLEGEICIDIALCGCVDDNKEMREVWNFILCALNKPRELLKCCCGQTVKDGCLEICYCKGPLVGPLLWNAV